MKDDDSKPNSKRPKDAVDEQGESSPKESEGGGKQDGLPTNEMSATKPEKRNASLATVQALAKALDLSPAFVSGSPLANSDAVAEAGRLFEEAPPEVQRAIINLLRATRDLKRRKR